MKRKFVNEKYRYMRYYYCNDDYFFGKDHPIDKATKEFFEVGNSLLELGFEDVDLIDKYYKALPGTDYIKNRILRDEISFKITAAYETVYDPDKIITVTDLSDYAFCPVSFAIKQTYKIQSNKNIEYGSQQHAKVRLIDRISPIDYQPDSETSFYNPQPYSDINSNEYFNDIFNSTLFFSGHNTTEKKWFLSPKKNLSGCPDYIFQKEDGTRIAVEEKFPTSDLVKLYQNGYDNNIIQLLAYLYALEELKLSYGYLIYWYYDKEFTKSDYQVYDLFEEQEAEQIETKYELKFKIVKVQKDKSNKAKLIDVFKSVQELKSIRKAPFLKHILIPKKCVNCSVSKYCKHKTGRYNSFTLPYDEENIENS